MVPQRDDSDGQRWLWNDCHAESAEVPWPTQPSPIGFGAIGDAYGFCFEFASADFVSRHNSLRMIQHPEFDVTPGVYSDDTQMQLALGELLISRRAWTPRNIADCFVTTFQRDPRQGYAKRFYSLLKRVTSGEELLGEIKPESERNGAAMRSPVLGVLPNVDDVIRIAQIQATVTHDTRGGVDSSVATALMSHYFLYRLGPRGEIGEFLSSHLPAYDWRLPWEGKVPVHGISTVRAAVTAILGSARLSEILVQCVRYTGDVDSVATIACACYSSSSECVHDLPRTLVSEVESGPYGLGYLTKIDRDVLDVVGFCRTDS